MAKRANRVASLAVVMGIAILMAGCVGGGQQGGSGITPGPVLPGPTFGGSGVKSFMGFSIRNTDPTRTIEWYVDGGHNSWQGPTHPGYSAPVGRLHATAGSVPWQLPRAPLAPYYYTAGPNGAPSAIAWTNQQVRLTDATLYWRWRGSLTFNAAPVCSTQHGCDTTSSCGNLYYFTSIRLMIDSNGSVTEDVANGGFRFAKRGHQMMVPPPPPPVPSDPGSGCPPGTPACVWHHHNDCACNPVDGPPPCPGGCLPKPVKPPY